MQPSSPESDDGKSSFAIVPVKGMRVVENATPPPKLNDRDKLDRIIRDLQDPNDRILQMMNQCKNVIHLSLKSVQCTRKVIHYQLD